MKDVEQAALLRNRNTSSGKNEEKSTLPPLPKPFLKARQPITIIYRVSIIGGLLYFLHTANVFATVLYGPKISHGWLKIGMATSVGKLLPARKLYIVGRRVETAFCFILFQTDTRLPTTTSHFPPSPPTHDDTQLYR